MNKFGHFLKIRNVYRTNVICRTAKKVPRHLFITESRKENIYQKAVEECRRAGAMMKKLQEMCTKLPKCSVNPYIRKSTCDKGDWCHRFRVSDSQGQVFCKSDKDDCDKGKPNPICECPERSSECGKKKDVEKDKGCENVRKDKCKEKEDPCGKKKDTCKKEKDDPCKKKEDPCKKEKEDPCKKKDDTCKKKEEDPCKKKKEDPCKKKKEDPCKKKDKDPCKKEKEDPCKKKEDTCKKKEGDPCKKEKEDTCKKKKEDPCKKKEQESSKKDPCKKKKSEKKKDPCKNDPSKKPKNKKLCYEYPDLNDPCLEPSSQTRKIKGVGEDYNIFDEVDLIDHQKLSATESYFKDCYQNPTYHSFTKHAYYDIFRHLKDKRNPVPKAKPKLTDEECD